MPQAIDAVTVQPMSYWKIPARRAVYPAMRYSFVPSRPHNWPLLRFPAYRRPWD